MNRYGNKLAALLMAFGVILSLSACGGSGNSDPLATAMDNMDKAESMDAAMVMEMDMDIAGTTLESVTTMNMSVFNKPMRMKTDMTVDMGGYGDVGMQLYAEETEDGAMVMYIYDGMDWSKQDVTQDDLSQYDAGSNMDFYMQNTTNFQQQDGTEQMNGVSTYKYTGVITGQSMQDVMESSGALDSLSINMGMDTSEMAEMLSGLGDITVTMWIDEENLYPVRFDMDMTDIMDGLVGKIVETMGSEAEGVSIGITKMTLSMSCSNFNSATEFTIPDEAKNA